MNYAGREVFRMAKANRILYFDNLRLLMILFVVVLHLAVTYSGLGSWYYIEAEELDTVHTVFFGFYLCFTQGYSMGLLFLLAGYFVPASYDTKGFGKFIKDRLIRLGLPALFYMLVISPIIGILFGSGSGAYYHYIVSFEFLGASGPLWFAFALLLFSIVYAVVRKFFAIKAGNNDKAFPASHKIVALFLFISVCAFSIRIIQPIGTSILNMQLCYFSQYIILFIIGIKCKRNNWLENLTYAAGRVWLTLGLALGFIVWAILMLSGGALSGHLDLFMGGLTWQSAAYSLWESFVAVAMSIGLIALFKEKCDKQSKLIKTMADNAFSVYVFHAPIIIALSLLLAPIKFLPILKFAVLVLISIPVCFLFTNYVVRRVAFLRRLLA
ncbi:MAG: acyltransferase family protein [Firmicutes bacterium]|nr:acyltransferase family protein [Bacillota bacterium]